MTGGCRTFGELVTILERDVLKELLDAFSKLRDAIRANSAAADGSKVAHAHSHTLTRSHNRIHTHNHNHPIDLTIKP